MTWSLEQLIATLEELRARRGDTTSIEVKRASGGLPGLSETICAFANMPAGGTIILGIDEADGGFEITGIEDEAALEAGVASTARNAVAPSPHVEFQGFTLGEARVLVAQVAPLPLALKPAYTGGKAYLRQADGDFVMSEYDLRMLEVARLGYDERIHDDLRVMKGLSIEDLDEELIETYLRRARRRDSRLRNWSDAEVLRLTSILTASGEPTLAGLYALGRYPQGADPALTVTAAVQLPGGEGRARTQNLQDFTGPIPTLLTGVLDWVAANIDTVQQYQLNGHMRDVPEFPLNAIRELISNALVHRDLGAGTLGLGKSIQVRLTPRALIILSPGGLRGVSLAQIESTDHAQAAVNQHLYQIAKRLGASDGEPIIEGEGGGIGEVFRSFEGRGLPRPLLVDTGLEFKAVLWRERDQLPFAAPSPILLHPQTPRSANSPELASPASTPSPPTAEPELASAPESEDVVPLPRSSNPSRNEEAVLRALASSPRLLAIDQIARNTGLTVAQVRYALRQPLRERLVIMDGGQGRARTRYRLVTQPLPSLD